MKLDIQLNLISNHEIKKYESFLEKTINERGQIF